MSLIKYNSYKNPDVKWLGKVPSNWQIKRLKDLMDFQGGAAFSSKQYTETGIQLILIGNLYQNKLSLERNPTFVPKSLISHYSRYKVTKGDILMSLTGTLGKKDYGFAILLKDNNTYLLNQRVAKLKCKKGVNVRHMIYLLQSDEFVSELLTLPKGTKQGNLSEDQIFSMEVPFFEFNEQTQIANYLDKKTVAIDKKVELLEQKARYYKELRKSLINETVCRGLNKEVKLVDSGIVWIGKIPEHWEVKRFKSFARTIKGKNLETSEIQFKKALPLLSLEFLRNDSVAFDSFCYSSDKSLKTNLGDLIIVWDGAAVGEIIKAKEGYISSTIAKIDFNKKVYSSRYFYFLRENIDYMLKKIPTGMGIPHLNPYLLNNYQCPKPPLKEQIEIAEYLEEKSGKIDQIITNINSQILTLKELRKTLINDVVTGKVRVSEVVEENALN